MLFVSFLLLVPGSAALRFTSVPMKKSGLRPWGRLLPIPCPEFFCFIGVYRSQIMFMLLFVSWVDLGVTLDCLVDEVAFPTFVKKQQID